MNLITKCLAAAALLSAASYCLHAQQASGAAAKAQPVAKPVIDPAAIELLRQNQEAMLRLKSYLAECRMTITREKPTGDVPPTSLYFASLRAEKPNKVRFDEWLIPEAPGDVNSTRPAAPPMFTTACDGARQFQQFGPQYREAPDCAPARLSTGGEPWSGFFTRKESQLFGSIDPGPRYQILIEARILGIESVDGASCQVVYFETRSKPGAEAADYRYTWYLDRSHLVRRLIEHTTYGTQMAWTSEALVTNIRVNERVDPLVYRYSPPPGVTLMAKPAPKPLLANGSAAPDFKSTDAAKMPVSLSDYRRSVVVLDFWASWCGPCKASMPHTQKVAQKLAAAGLPVVVLAVDNEEERIGFDEWVKVNGKRFAGIKFVHVPPADRLSDLYKVTGIPTQYVIDKTGIIRASFVGYDKPNDDLEKAVRAALIPGR